MLNYHNWSVNCRLIYNVNPFTIQSVPEPSPGILLGLALAGLVGVGVVRKIKKKGVGY
ncbi:PEP-CTERM sorting domain-containing protein [Candidatus Scalindua japonica]